MHGQWRRWWRCPSSLPSRTTLNPTHHRIPFFRNACGLGLVVWREALRASRVGARAALQVVERSVAEVGKGAKLGAARTVAHASVDHSGPSAVLRGEYTHACMRARIYAPLFCGATNGCFAPPRPPSRLLPSPFCKQSLIRPFRFPASYLHPPSHTPNLHPGFDDHNHAVSITAAESALVASS